uniref:Uncharacterized protein n=1 Tax=Paenibacillus athensensis TaxID=1967502 RepID=A0A4Y8Q0E9_9BACL
MNAGNEVQVVLKLFQKLFHAWSRLSRTEQATNSGASYKAMEIEVVIKCFVSDYEKPFRVIFKVLRQGSFFTKHIFIQPDNAKSHHELFYNYSALGMSPEELKKYGATDHAEYRFATIEEARKVKETTAQYIRFLIREHQQEQVAKIS